MKPIIIINTFRSIFFQEGKKPLIICDIDNTFIQPKFDHKHYYEIYKNSGYDDLKAHALASDMVNDSICVGSVKQTDQEGFNIMLQKIQSLGGKLIFLTARNYKVHKKTLKDLVTAGLNAPEEFEIHYTNNEISKGDYIKNHNLLNGYNQHIFIDDFPHFLNSAARIYPNMDCYLFKYE